MGFWNNLKLTDFTTPLISKVREKSSDEKQNKNRNIFNNLLQQVPKDTFEKSHKRLNDTDSNILNKNLIQFLPTDSLRIELRLDNAEKDLKDVDKEINAVKLLELDKNGNKLAQLEEKKELINKEIQNYKDQYRNLGLLYKITDVFAESYNKTKEMIQQANIAFLGSSTIIKIKNIIPGLKEKEEIKSILNKFNALQINTKKIFSIKTNPFGEKEDYFKDIVNLMNKANKLDFQTDKFLSSTQQAKSKIYETANNTFIKAADFIQNLKEKIILAFTKANS